MALDLEGLGREIEEHLESSGLAVFFGQRGALDLDTTTSWDTEGHPDFKEFLETARRGGAKLVVFRKERFEFDELDEAQVDVESSDLARDVKRTFERQLKEFRKYEGFVYVLQLSFTLENELYVFEVHAEWYDGVRELLSEIEVATGSFLDDEDEEEDSDPLAGGYYSKN